MKFITIQLQDDSVLWLACLSDQLENTLHFIQNNPQTKAFFVKSPRGEDVIVEGFSKQVIGQTF